MDPINLDNNYRR